MNIHQRFSKFTLLCTLLLLVLASACRKDEITTNTDIDIPEPTVKVLGNILGLVTDSNGNPIAEATVNLANAQTLTDENGYFNISDITAQNRTIVRVEKAGYFTAHHVLSAYVDDYVKTSIQLTERALSASFAASTGGVVSVNGGGSVRFSGGSFVDTQGNAYSGMVNVYSTYLDPTIDNLAAVMPGNLMAINTESELQVLQSFGMMNVELEGENGQALQINQAAELTVPVPSALQSNAPDEIPLWYFDETAGLWVEEGKAELQNGVYIGMVEHFTFWNCDYPYDFVHIDGQLEGGPFTADLKVRITELASGTSITSGVSSKGFFDGFVPKDLDLLFEVISPCGDVVYTSNLGMLSVDLSMGQITINIPTNNWTTITGSVVNCDQNPVTNGYVMMSGVNAISFAPLTSGGTFFSGFPNCGATTINVTPVDVDNFTQGDPTTLNISSNLDAGQLVACGNFIVESVTFTINGQDRIIPNCYGEFSDSDSSFVYTINTLDEMPDGKVNYEFVILNWTGDPADDFWGIGYQKTIFNTPNENFDFAIPIDAQVELVNHATNPGENFIIILPNLDITETVSGVTYNNCSITLSGFLN